MSHENDSIQIHDESSDRSHFTMIPHIVDSMELDAIQFRLYYLLKKTAGENGRCFKANKTLCNEVGCSRPILVKAKEILASKGLIRIKKQFHANGGKMPDLISIVDLWPQNCQYIASLISQNSSGGRKQDYVGVGNPFTQGRKRGYHKEDLKQEEKKEEEDDDLIREGAEENSQEKQPTASQATMDLTGQTGADMYTLHLYDGTQITISGGDVYTAAIQHRKDWNQAEIRHALNSIKSSCPLIRDWVKYIDGVITNFRKQNKTTKKENKECKQKHSKSESQTIKKNTSDYDTGELVSVEAVYKSMMLEKSQRSSIKEKTS